MSLSFSGGLVHPEEAHEEEPYHLHCSQCDARGGEAASMDSALLAALHAGFHIRPFQPSEFISMKSISFSVEAICPKCFPEWNEVEEIVETQITKPKAKGVVTALLQKFRF
jgi:hypothetical protein